MQLIYQPPNLPLDYSRIPEENNQRQQAKNLAACVLDHKDKKAWSLSKWTAILLFFIVLSSIFWSMARILKPNSNTKSAILSADTFRNSKFTLEDTDNDLYFSIEEEWTQKDGFTTLVQVADSQGNILEEKKLIGGLMNAYLYKHYLNFKPWLVVETGVGANGVLTYIYHFDKKMNLKLIPKIIKGEISEEPFSSRVFLYDDSNNGDPRLKLYLFQRTFSNSLYKDSIRIDYAYENEGFVEIE